METKKAMQKGMALLLSTILMCCSDDDSMDNNFAQYTGNYDLVSFRSDMAVNLNGDGTITKELLDEITTLGDLDLEIRPTLSQTNQVKLISFFFPSSRVSFQYPGILEGSVEFFDYGFGTTYEFLDKNFHLMRYSYSEDLFVDNVQEKRSVFLDSHLSVKKNDQLGISISKEYYDFNTREWIRLNISVTYGKID